MKTYTPSLQNISEFYSYRSYKYYYNYANHPEKGIDNLYMGDLNSEKEYGYNAVLAYIPYTTGSDYSGGSVEKANYQYCKDHFTLLWKNQILYDVYGGYSSYGIMMNVRRLNAVMRFYNDDSDLYNECSNFIDEVNSLDNYPAFSDDYVSSLEMELEDEALTGYIIPDLLRAIENKLYNDDIQYTAINEDVLRQYLYQYMDKHNLYFEIETGCSAYLKLPENEFIDEFLNDYDVLAGKLFYKPENDKNQLKLNI